jgi:hypothetical protein
VNDRIIFLIQQIHEADSVLGDTSNAFGSRGNLALAERIQNMKIELLGLKVAKKDLPATPHADRYITLDATLQQPTQAP